MYIKINRYLIAFVTDTVLVDQVINAIRKIKNITYRTKMKN